MSGPAASAGDPNPVISPDLVISVVTIVRNNAEGLEATRASLERQDWKHFEWLVIDGASTDGTADLVAALIAQGRAKGVSEADDGIYDAMNKGLERATGDYIVFLNAGDRFLDEASLATAARQLGASGRPEIGFFGSWMDFGDHRVRRPARDPAYIWHGQPGLHQASFFAREFHQRHPFRPHFRVCGDYDVLARMKMAGARMKSFPEVIGVNEFDRRSTSNRFKAKLLDEALWVQREVLGLPWPVRLTSLARRAAVSVTAKALTWKADLGKADLGKAGLRKDRDGR